MRLRSYPLRRAAKSYWTQPRAEQYCYKQKPCLCVGSTHLILQDVIQEHRLTMQIVQLHHTFISRTGRICATSCLLSHHRDEWNHCLEVDWDSGWRNYELSFHKRTFSQFRQVHAGDVQVRSITVSAAIYRFPQAKRMTCRFTSRNHETGSST